MRTGGPIVAAIAILISAAATGCMSDNEATVTDVPPKGWSDPAVMVYTNRDTIPERRVILVMRHDNRTAGGRYAVEYRAPSGTVATANYVRAGRDRKTPGARTWLTFLRLS